MMTPDEQLARALDRAEPAPAIRWSSGHAQPDGAPTTTTATRLRALELVEAQGVIDAADLLAMELPELRMIVPDLLPEGTSVLVAPPKVGKSCLVYQIAVEVSLGGSLFDERVESGSVLYLALEDGMRRGRDRLLAVLGGRTLPRGRLDVRWDAPRIGAGLEEEIETWLDAHADAAVVAIDTLGKVRPKTATRASAYDVDVQDIGRLQNLFRDRAVALVIVHHTNKGSSDDFVSQVSGTYGVAGSVDTIINVQRKRSDAFGTITVTGRDVADNRMAVRFDELTWHAAPNALSDASISRVEVFRTVQALQPTWPKKVADALDLKRTNVQNLMTALADEGALMRTAKGYVVAEGHHQPLKPPYDSTDWESQSSHGGAKGDSTDPSPIRLRGRGMTVPGRVRQDRELHIHGDAWTNVLAIDAGHVFRPVRPSAPWAPSQRPPGGEPVRGIRCPRGT